MPEAAPSPFGRISLNRRVASSLGLVGPCTAGGGPGFLASAHGDGRRRLSRWSHSIHCQQAWSLLLLCPGFLHGGSRERGRRKNGGRRALEEHRVSASWAAFGDTARKKRVESHCNVSSGLLAARALDF